MAEFLVQDKPAAAAAADAAADPIAALDHKIPLFTEGTWSRRGLVLAAQISLLVALVAGWQFFAGIPGKPHVLIDEYYVSEPSAIWEALKSFQDSGVLLSNTWSTLETTLYGFLIGAGLGFVFGVLLGLNRLLAQVLNPFVDALYAIPRLALVPLFFLWFGIGLGSRLALVVSVVGFLVFYATYAGVRDVDHEMIDRMRLMRARAWHVHLKATLPSATAFIISGLSISGPYALVVAVTAEMLSSNSGLGYLLIKSSNSFNTAGTFAIILVLMVLGVLLMLAVRGLEAWLLRWKPKRSGR